MILESRMDKLRQEDMEHYGFGPVSMKKRKVCTFCKGITSASQPFCKECGHILPKETMYQLYSRMHKTCSVCGTVLTDAMQYCPQCGEMI